MKRLLTAFIMTAILLAGCAYVQRMVTGKPEETPEAAENPEEEIQTVGEYTIYNTTGSPVIELYLYPTGGSEKGTNHAAEPFGDGNRIVLNYDAGAAAKETELTLEFKTESGYSAAFTTLHIETAPIYLLAVDALTGATPISFRSPD